MQLEEVKEYYDNGKIHRHYFLDEHKRRQGKYIVYYDNSGISFEANYKDDKKHGKYIDYNGNGYNGDGTIDYIGYYWHDKLVTKAEFLKLKYDEVMK